MKRTLIDINAPAYWASYLINGDDSGYGFDEKNEINAWLHSLPDNVADCQGIQDETDGEGDAHFIGRFNFPHQGTLQCDMFTYTFLIEGE